MIEFMNWADFLNADSDSVNFCQTDNLLFDI